MTATRKSKWGPWALAIVTLAAFAFASLALQAQQHDRAQIRARFCAALNDNRDVLRNVLLVSRAQSMKFAQTAETRTQVKLFYRRLLDTTPPINCRSLK